MCSLEEEPWRANFTGEKCRCGVPMPGTPEEEELQNRMEEMKRNEKRKKQQEQLAHDRQKRIDNFRNWLRRY